MNVIGQSNVIGSFSYSHKKVAKVPKFPLNAVSRLKIAFQILYKTHTMVTKRTSEGLLTLFGSIQRVNKRLIEFFSEKNS